METSGDHRTAMSVHCSFTTERGKRRKRWITQRVGGSGYGNQVYVRIVPKDGNRSGETMGVSGR